MKDFFKMVLAVICGIFILSIISTILSVMVLGAMLAAGSAQPSMPKSAVLKIDMSQMVIGEQTTDMPAIDVLNLGSTVSTIGLWDAAQALDKAAQDPGIKYVYLLTDGNATGISNNSEFRAALARFRSSGKPVVAYMESPSTGSYYLASVADKVYMTSYQGATTMLNGVSTQMLFFGDLLKKFDVDVQLIRHGKYKSAGEQFTRGESSPENREQYQRMIDSMWENISKEIASSRDFTVEQLNDAIDNLTLCSPEDFLQQGFVDGLLTRQELEAKLATLFVVDEFKDVKMVDFADYAAAKVVPSKAKDKIAVIYADGNIIDGSDKTQVAGDRFASVISKVRADSTVKAVVLRVNSPGGSVLASEKIKNELDLLKADKPLVASYGSYAASGGYWISNNCDRIYADATTLTGSIGVFSMIPNLGETAKNIAHVGVETVASNRHGNIYDMMHHFDDDEYAYMLKSIESIYDRFTTIVSEGRGMEKEAVDEIGQGRVWTGADALGIGLVDEIGTLEDAIRYAASAAGDPDLAKWNVKGYPAPPSQMQMIMDMLGKGGESDAELLTRAVRTLGTPQAMARLPYEIEVK